MMNDEELARERLFQSITELVSRKDSIPFVFSYLQSKILFSLLIITVSYIFSPLSKSSLIKRLSVHSFKILNSECLLFPPVYFDVGKYLLFSFTEQKG